MTQGEEWEFEKEFKRYTYSFPKSPARTYLRFGILESSDSGRGYFWEGYIFLRSLIPQGLNAWPNSPTTLINLGIGHNEK